MRQLLLTSDFHLQVDRLWFRWDLLHNNAELVFIQYSSMTIHRYITQILKNHVFHDYYGRPWLFHTNNAGPHPAKIVGVKEVEFRLIWDKPTRNCPMDWHPKAIQQIPSLYQPVRKHAIKICSDRYSKTKKGILSCSKMIILAWAERLLIDKLNLKKEYSYNKMVLHWSFFMGLSQKYCLRGLSCFIRFKNENHNCKSFLKTAKIII